MIRDYVAEDETPVVELSLRAWEPVYASVEGALGTELNTLLHGEDWRPWQAAEVREALAFAGAHTRVAEIDGRLAGFATARVADPRRLIGEVSMLAVDPATQRRGLGRELTEVATAWLREAGMRVVFIGTGGDPGHAPARRLYERAGYTPFPVEQYYKVL